MSNTTKAPTAAATLKAVQDYIAAHKVGNTIGNGHLYVAWFMLILKGKGMQLSMEDNTLSIFKDGKLVAIAGWTAAHVLSILQDPAGKSLVERGPLKVERILSWAQTGKVQPNVKGVVLGKAPRVAIAAGNLPT